MENCVFNTPRQHTHTHFFGKEAADYFLKIKFPKVLRLTRDTWNYDLRMNKARQRDDKMN